MEQNYITNDSGFSAEDFAKLQAMTKEETERFFEFEKK